MRVVTSAAGGGESGNELWPKYQHFLSVESCGQTSGTDAWCRIVGGEHAGFPERGLCGLTVSLQARGYLNRRITLSAAVWVGNHSAEL